ncbi:MAG: ATP-binding cassette domain-containing protein [Planctomycetota bacterium]|nr:ATP-binding cassette domain-containing protein [Planctomycetota bacterium]
MAEQALRIQGISRAFDDVQALKEVSFDVPSGGVFGFLGMNGAGKTTTIRAVMGLMRLDSGSVHLLGKPVSFASNLMAHKVGYLPQEHGFYEWMSAFSYVSFCARAFGLSRSNAAKKAEMLLSLTGLSEAKSRKIRGFSTGMKQRLALASALVNDPDLLVLDEPASSLDPAGRSDVLKLLQELGSRATVFMSTHILSDVERVCSRVAVIHKGELVTVEDVAALRERYSDHSWAVRFSSADELTPAASHLSSLPFVSELRTAEERPELEHRVGQKCLVGRPARGSRRASAKRLFRITEDSFPRGRVPLTNKGDRGMRGFTLMFFKEVSEFAATHKLLVAIVLFILIGLGSPLLAELTPMLVAQFGSSTPGMEILMTEEPDTTDALIQFHKNFVLLPILVILVSMGTVSSEVRRDVAKMVLTKPVSRAAYVLGKFAAPSLIYVFCTVIAAACCYFYTITLFGSVWLIGFAAMTGLFALYLIFYHALTLFLSSLLSSAAATAAVAFGVYALFSVVNMFPAAAAYTPGGLSALALQLIQGQKATMPYATLISAGVCTFALIALACFVTARKEM